MLWAGVAAFASSGCHQPAQHSTRVARFDLLTLERTACFGTCPEYVVTVDAKGRVTFRGGRYAQTARAEGQVSAAVLESIVFELNQADFLSLKERYETEADGCGLMTDMPTVTITLASDGRRKRVRHYLGCWQVKAKPVERQKMPPDAPPPWGPVQPMPELGCPYPVALYTLENRIDFILDTAKWAGNSIYLDARCTSQAGYRQKLMGAAEPAHARDRRRWNRERRRVMRDRWADTTMVSRRRTFLRALCGVCVISVLGACGGRRLDGAAPSGAAEPPPVKVGSILVNLKPTTMVCPTLPPEAIERGITGPVLLEIRVSETGDVSVVQVLRGDPVLHQAAKTAVSQWKYRPYIFAGRAIPLFMVVVAFGSSGCEAR